MWDDADIEAESTPELPPAAEETAAAAAAPAEGAPVEGAKPEEAETPAPENPLAGFEPRKLVFRHWTRPKSHQYRYISDYRQNYYSDLISYMDRRNNGLPVERPKAQTWGERALKTYLANTPKTYTERLARDDGLLRHISTGARFHRYHSKSLISRKYSRFGFNIVSI